MRTRLAGFLALMLSGTLALAQDANPTLEVGDDAPALTVSKFVKGEPVAKFEKDTVYVVEFWATWCGPCRATIPHLTELQKKYKDKDVVMIGVDAFEPDTDEVAPFLKEMGDKMDYRVALDDVPAGKSAQDGKMAKNWMEAANQNGIPTAFIIDQKTKVAWIGHPMQMDDVLEAVVAGNYDPEAIKKKESRLQELAASLARADGDDAMKIVEEMEGLVGDNDQKQAQVHFMAFGLMKSKGNDEGTAAMAGKLLESPLAENPALLNQIAWTIVDPDLPGDIGDKSLAVARKAAEKAVEATPEDQAWAVLDTLALVQFRQGEVEKALATQEKAVKAAGDAIDDQPEMKERLQQYRDAAKKK